MYIKVIVPCSCLALMNINGNDLSKIFVTYWWTSANMHYILNDINSFYTLYPSFDIYLTFLNNLKDIKYVWWLERERIIDTIKVKVINFIENGAIFYITFYITISYFLWLFIFIRFSW